MQTKNEVEAGGAGRDARGDHAPDSAPESSEPVPEQSCGGKDRPASARKAEDGFGLLARLHDGSDDAWTECWCAHKEPARKTARRMRLRHADVKDVFLETMVSLVQWVRKLSRQEVPNLDGNGLRALVLTIARCRTADHLRKDRRLAGSDDEEAAGGNGEEAKGVPDPGPTPFEALCRKEQEMTVAVAVTLVAQRVGAGRYRVFELLCLNRLPARQVAAETGLAVRRVYTIARHVRILLQREIRKLQAAELHLRKTL